MATALPTNPPILDPVSLFLFPVGPLDFLTVRLIPRSRWIRRALVLLLVATSIGVAWLWKASQAVPEFYAERLVVEAEGPTEEQLQDLDTALTKDGSWRVAFTEEDVNAWLANVMPYQFPHTVPPYASDPRVRFDDGYVQVACQYKHEELSAVISVNVHLDTIDRPNSVAMRISDPKIGAVPGPGNMAADQLRMAAARARMHVVWREGPDPMGEVTLPAHVLKTKNKVIIEEIVFEKGRLVVAGTTKVVAPAPVPAAAPAAKPAAAPAAAPAASAPAAAPAAATSP